VIDHLEPVYDVYESDDKLFFILDIPGANKNNSKIKIKNGVLHIKSKRNLYRNGFEIKKSECVNNVDYKCQLEIPEGLKDIKS